MSIIIDGMDQSKTKLPHALYSRAKEWSKSLVFEVYSYLIAEAENYHKINAGHILLGQLIMALGYTPILIF